VFFETGSAETFDVKLVVDENYRANRVLEDRQNGQTIWQVSFTALEV
jgi:predicted nucleic acid-binding protein